MTDQRIRKVVIVGGGTTGWMAAAAVSHVFKDRSVAVELIESDAIGTVGVGEATLPPIRLFNAELGVNEREFIKATKASFKLGIAFHDWKQKGSSFFHGFGDFGLNIAGSSPLQAWMALRQTGRGFDYESLSIPTVMARSGKFAPPHPDPRSPLSSFAYAYHFDAGLYAGFLRSIAQRNGVKRTEGRVVGADLRGDDGFIAAVVLDSGARIEGDVFLDCSGFIGLLIDGALKVEFEDFSRHLPVNRAWAVPCAKGGAFTPYTQSTALEAGWRWRIPLQHRTGNGYVFCNDHISEDEAAGRLLGSLDGEALAEPRLLKFTTGRRRQFWRKNCVALGLASGFLEPLESTSISLIQNGIARFLEFFPDKRFDQRIIDEYNRVQADEFDRMRDFIILHYHGSQRTDAPFWRSVREVGIPAPLAEKLKIFKACGHIPLGENDSFKTASWQSILYGLGVEPERYDPTLDAQDLDGVAAELKRRRDGASAAMTALPSHAEFIRLYGAASA